MPRGVGIVDTMIDFPHGDLKALYSFLTRQTKDRQSKEEFTFPAQYMFKDAPRTHGTGVDDPVGLTVSEMDRWGIEKGLVGIAGAESPGTDAIRRYPDRFI